MIFTMASISAGLIYTHYFNTFTLKLSTPPGISADIGWASDPADKEDFYDTTTGATLTDRQNLNVQVTFWMEKFASEESRASGAQNLMDLWRWHGADHSLPNKDQITPTISKLKNGDYIVSGFYNGVKSETVSQIVVVRTFDFNNDGLLDCYFVFVAGTIGRMSDVEEYLVNYFASSAEASPYSIANWNPLSY